MFSKKILLQVVVLVKQMLCNVVINNCTSTIPDVTLHDVNVLKDVTKNLADSLEKWNNLFLNKLEPRMVSTATSLANIDSNVGNLQERAHVWDTFQLHVSAWNEQLATLDRKADIISKAQEKIPDLESKMNSLFKLEYKIEDALKKIEQIQDNISKIKEETQSRNVRQDRDTLFGEFATRGVLSSIKVIEKKLDRLLLTQQNSVIYQKNLGERPKLTIKCNAPRFVEELLNDISSKVDIIFDKVNAKEEIESDFDNEDYVDDESGIDVEVNANQTESEHDKIIKYFKKLFERISKIENVSEIILSEEKMNLAKLNTMFETCMTDTKFDKITNQYYESLLSKIDNNKCRNKDVKVTNNDLIISEPNKSGCEDLNENYTSGIYIFKNNTEFNAKNRTFDEKYCIFRNEEFWTLIQSRGSSKQSFNSSWFDYKHGFGNLDEDFWFGNDFISKLSKENDLILRIELEDFEGNRVWAEYHKFLVLSEANKYQIILGDYRGNASDSLSSHNSSFFSTFDKRHDQAPECCPCAVSYGGGWWFNSCFESNLNGLYYKKGEYNGYYGGIIWETWQGDHSLKKTLMMVRPSNQPKQQGWTWWHHYEDP